MFISWRKTLKDCNLLVSKPYNFVNKPLQSGLNIFNLVQFFLLLICVSVYYHFYTECIDLNSNFYYAFIFAIFSIIMFYLIVNIKPTVIKKKSSFFYELKCKLNFIIECVKIEPFKAILFILGYSIMFIIVFCFKIYLFNFNIIDFNNIYSFIVISNTSFIIIKILLSTLIYVIYSNKTESYTQHIKKSMSINMKTVIMMWIIVSLVFYIKLAFLPFINIAAISDLFFNIKESRNIISKVSIPDTKGSSRVIYKWNISKNKTFTMSRLNLLTEITYNNNSKNIMMHMGFKGDDIHKTIDVNKLSGNYLFAKGKRSYDEIAGTGNTDNSGNTGSSNRRNVRPRRLNSNIPISNTTSQLSRIRPRESRDLLNIRNQLVHIKSTINNTKNTNNSGCAFNFTAGDDKLTRMSSYIWEQSKDIQKTNVIQKYHRHALNGNDKNGLNSNTNPNLLLQHYMDIYDKIIKRQEIINSLEPDNYKKLPRENNGTHDNRNFLVEDNSIPFSDKFLFMDRKPFVWKIEGLVCRVGQEVTGGKVYYDVSFSNNNFIAIHCFTVKEYFATFGQARSPAYSENNVPYNNHFACFLKELKIGGVKALTADMCNDPSREHKQYNFSVLRDYYRKYHDPMFSGTRINLTDEIIEGLVKPRNKKV